MENKNHQRQLVTVVLKYAFLVLISIISIFPFYWMFVVGSNSNASINRFPPQMLPGTNFIANLSKAISMSPFMGSIVNSCIVSVTITLFLLFLASLAGYTFSKIEFPFKNALFVFILFTMMIPVQIGVIPRYMIVSKLGWVDSLVSVIIPSLVNSFGVFWMRQYITTAVPDELVSAAKIDGCGPFNVFLRIIVPIIQPGFATLGILTFMQAWNDYFWPSVVLHSNSSLTIQLALRTLNDANFQDYSVILSATFIATLPLLLVFLFFNKQFIAGIAEGALK